MLSLLEIVKKSSDFLSRKGIEQPRLNAELVIGHCLDLDRMQLYLQFERLLTDAELAPIREKVRRRGAREPLQYILGTVPFHDLVLKVDPRVLVPRPETEQLVEWIRDRLDPPPRSILDLGTGSGALALSLGRIYPEAVITAVDSSAEALEVAEANAVAASLDGRVRFLRSDWFAAVPAGDLFDLVVSNPPYLSEEEWAGSEPEVRVHEPKNALVAKEEGYADLEVILSVSRDRLVPGGTLVLETGMDQHPRLMEKARSLSYDSVESLKDWSERDRFLWMRAPKK